MSFFITPSPLVSLLEHLLHIKPLPLNLLWEYFHFFAGKICGLDAPQWKFCRVCFVLVVCRIGEVGLYIFGIGGECGIVGFHGFDYFAS